LCTMLTERENMQVLNRFSFLTVSKMLSKFSFAVGLAA
jgi:hypothetical protein